LESEQTARAESTVQLDEDNSTNTSGESFKNVVDPYAIDIYKFYS